MIRERVAHDLREALKSKDAQRVGTLRLITAAVKDRDIAARSDENTEGIGDEEIQALLARMIRQRQEGAKAYEEGGRLDLAAQELAEIDIIRSYLPRQMTENEVRAAVAEAIAETGAASIRDVGKVMARLKSRHTGQMDFTRACAAVKQSLD